MLAHAFASFDSVVFRIGAGNLRSRRAVAKLGAVEESRFTDAAGVEGLTCRLSRAGYAAAVR